MEQKNVKIFYKPVDGGELKELECVAESDGFEFEPLGEPIDVKYDPTPVTNSLSFDIDVSKVIFASCFIQDCRERKRSGKRNKLL